MAPRYDEAPEVAPQYLPEVHYPPTAPEVTGYNQYYQQSSPATPITKQEQSSLSPGYSSAHPTSSSTYGHDHQLGGYGAGSTTHPDGSVAAPHSSKKQRLICGCSGLVFTLSLIIALLSVAVIGLAAGTGITANRANDAESKLAVYSAKASSATASPSSTSTSSAPASTATNFDSLSRNCSTSSGSVSGTTYKSQFYKQQSYLIYCNKDTVNPPLQSLFVGNFDDCIDACASWSSFMPSDFPDSAARNQTCSGISFIPAWTNRTFAFVGGAPGNCYLKPGPQNKTALVTPNIGTEVHAAILADG